MIDSILCVCCIINRVRHQFRSVPFRSITLRSIICSCMASLSTVVYLHLKLYYVHPFQDIVGVRVVPSQ
jgi:hypothetical protein